MAKNDNIIIRTIFRHMHKTLFLSSEKWRPGCPNWRERGESRWFWQWPKENHFFAVMSSLISYLDWLENTLWQAVTDKWYSHFLTLFWLFPDWAVNIKASTCATSETYQTTRSWSKICHFANNQTTRELINWSMFSSNPQGLRASHSDWWPGPIVSYALEVFPNPGPPGPHFTHFPVRCYQYNKVFIPQVDLFVSRWA